MPKPITLLVALVVALSAAFSVAEAESPTSLVVYPFSSQDVLLGFAVAEQVASAFEDSLEVLGPASTTNLIPPLVLEDGFLSPVNLLSSSPQSADIGSVSGAAVVRDTLGSDLAISGRIRFVEQHLRLELYIASAAGVRRATLEAPEDDPGLLARRASALLSGLFGVPSQRAALSIDLSGDYGDYVRALALLSGGFLIEAQQILEQLAAQEGAEPRYRALASELELLLQGEFGENAAFQAAAALSLSPLREEEALPYFERFAQVSGLPVAQLWIATLKASIQDADTAAAFTAAADYPYGAAARSNYLAVQGEQGADADVRSLLGSRSRAALLAASVAARRLDDLALEKDILIRLGRVAPELPYSFERRSFIAFDEDDALTAAQTLVVATRLEPDSDLYWTNLGWAYYLLGFLERSEEATRRAIELRPAQEIAWYNLGLTKTVTGRLEAAMDAYREALRLDPDVNDEAIFDLEEALEHYPNEPAVHYALGTLYEAKGRRREAALQFSRYADRGTVERFRSRARERVTALRAPPPPIEISDGARLSLGRGGPDVSPYRPGDRVFPRFELFTPGVELPQSVVVALHIEDQAGSKVPDSALEQQLRIPSNAVAIDITDIGVDLPRDLSAGSYQLIVNVTADPERRTRFDLAFEVNDEPVLLRQLLSRNVMLRTLDTGQALYRRDDLSRSDPDGMLIEVLLQELQDTADTAEEVLPVVTRGRFEGQDGGELFRESSEQDVRDFLTYLLRQGAASDADVNFVDAYAQWALDGAESP